MPYCPKIWVYTNLLFVIAYTINYIPYLIRIPITVNKYILIILLIASYISTFDISETLKNPRSALSKSNTYCLLLFMTFPAKILVLPFFFISILNISAYIIRNRSRFESYFFYEMSKKIMRIKRECYLYCYLLEILMVFLCFLLIPFGQCTLITPLAYFYVVLFEYKNNQVMRDACYIVQKQCDLYSEYFGPARVYYFKVRDCIIRNFAIREQNTNK